MISNSAPRDERTESVSASILRSNSAEADARRPSPFSERLARTYDRFIDRYGDDLEIIGIAGCGAVPSALVFALAVQYGPFWAITTTACSIGFYAVGMISVIGLRDKLAEVKDSELYQLCEARKDVCDALQDENTQLEHDKAWLLCERGQLLRQLKVAEAAAGLTSERQESAAVVEFPNPKGAA